MSTSLSRSPFGPFSPVQHLRFGDERFQDVPGWPEYPAYTVDVVSCELPSGVAWLFSCLLELRVPAWKPWNADTRLEWIPRGNYRYRYWCAGDPWTRLSPGLVSERGFVFRAGPVPRYTHAWPDTQPPCPYTILVVRDPRDALYSAWRREEASLGLDGRSAERFIAYANAPCGEQAYRRADYWDRFHAAWLEWIVAKPCLTIRFEDFKRDPPGVLENVCAFLDLPATAQEMTAAIAASDFGNVLRIDQDMVSRGVFNWAVNRAGTANEFVTTYTPEMRSVFSRHGMAIWQRLGYDPSA
jgi:Sulfotransferase domain